MHGTVILLRCETDDATKIENLPDILWYRDALTKAITQIINDG
jgi:hypothetical protein